MISLHVDCQDLEFLYLWHPSNVTSVQWVICDDEKIDRYNEDARPQENKPGYFRIDHLQRLLTMADDGIFRVWHPVTTSHNRLDFYLQYSIDPCEWIPGRSIQPQTFCHTKIVSNLHWLKTELIHSAWASIENSLRKSLVARRLVICIEGV